MIGSCLLLPQSIFICTRLKYSWLLLLDCSYWNNKFSMMVSADRYTLKRTVYSEDHCEYVVAGIDEGTVQQHKNPVRTALPGKTVQVKWNISTEVWSA